MTSGLRDFRIVQVDQLAEVMDCGRWAPNRPVDPVPFKQKLEKPIEGPVRYAFPPRFKLRKRFFRRQSAPIEYQSKHRIIVGGLYWRIPLCLVPYKADGHELYILAPAVTRMLPAPPNAPWLIARTRELVDVGFPAYCEALEHTYPPYILKSLQPGR